MDEEKILVLSEVSKFYTTAQNIVVGLQRITLSFSVGEFVAVTGESGSGKSTLAHILGGILPYESGEMFYRGKATSSFDGADLQEYRSSSVAFISQSYGILPGATVFDNITSALAIAGLAGKEAKARAKEILEEVDLTPYASRRAAYLSSGQKQRLSIARALAKPTKILIADEPTGNLDPESSEKVIRLLATAASERLVVLITHEFSEAEPYVTRHITLEDGRVAADAHLGKIPSGSGIPPAKNEKDAAVTIARPQKSRRSLPLKIALLAVKSRPILTLVLLFLFMAETFGIFAFLGSLIPALDDTDARIYSDAVFQNGDPARLVVIRTDGADMTEADYRTVASLPHVVRTERYGYAADVRYAYRENTDYVRSYYYGLGNFSGKPQEYVTLRAGTPFLKTVPLLKEGETFLSEGVLPEGFYEAVATRGAATLGEEVRIFLTDEKNYRRSQYIELVVRIVGITERGEGLWLSDGIGALAESMTKKPHYLWIPSKDTGLSDSSVILSREQKGDTVKIPAADDTPGFKLTVIGRNGSTQQNLLEVSPALFRKMTDTAPREELSVTMEDYAYTDRVTEALTARGYTAVSPRRIGADRFDTEAAEERYLTIGICVCALILTSLLQIFLCSALFSMQNDTYRLLSDIGLREKTAKASALLELFSLSVLGQILTFSIVFVLAHEGVGRLSAITCYLTFRRLLLLFGVGVLFTALTARRAVRSLKKQVYPNAAKEIDLPGYTDEEVTA